MPWASLDFRDEGHNTDTKVRKQGCGPAWASPQRMAQGVSRRDTLCRRAHHAGSWEDLVSVSGGDGDAYREDRPRHPASLQEHSGNIEGDQGRDGPQNLLDAESSLDQLGRDSPRIPLVVASGVGAHLQVESRNPRYATPFFRESSSPLSLSTNMPSTS